MTTRLNPYLGFRGNAKDAMEFYQSVFGGDLTLSTFRESGVGVEEAELDQIMHGSLVTDGGLALMGSDTPSHIEFRAGTNHQVSLSGEDEAELSGYWEKLSSAGTITMPLNKAPWGDIFGMCTDKYGVPWLVNISGAAQA
ncbi:3-demethylubiquinone-9 3-methyltransferase [Arthrobacter alpinus]|uniref:3-demethylubiquinone-9 3-methyltransferase n=1 Tax=Arthrobacter alpinus TaxID=656366 RepID=A0A0M5M0A0_9MICC|nr:MULTISPECIES: VOC family protein [Arthrobacter]ALE93282.1 3-demethylubiquinone-9 3-methyltransferase [Arthrobacter alpinus]